MVRGSLPPRLIVGRGQKLLEMSNVHERRPVCLTRNLLIPDVVIIEWTPSPR